ncbi:restriction endonuclease [Endozoicomonas sp.]|uniref:restriction endonuclease n=1 Tax=Endozoicomonas sp. TaxID=1892382 RepID=UPI0028861739|nr:restriction endonuclease [Endozoicomonas sp.]
MNYVLVRSPKELIKNSEIGYGWRHVDFSKYTSFNELINDGFKKQGHDFGRKKNQIRRYFNLTKNDVVIIPTAGAIAIAKVEGTKSFNDNSGIRHSQNQVKVNFLKDDKGNSFIPRKILSTQFQSRLKIRMAIADLNDFSEEIEKHVLSLNQGMIHTWKAEIEDIEERKEKEFKSELLSRLQNGEKIALSAGGYGLEKLVVEILKINNYEARIQAKNQSSGIDDIDIIAKKYNFLTGDSECLYIQVKHHTGTTSSKGLKQLTAYDTSNDDFTTYRKILISTAKFNEDLKNKAEAEGVVTIEGSDFVNLIYDNIDKLSQTTKESLGIIISPQLI